MVRFQVVADAPSPCDFIPVSLPWILEAGNPYFSWLFGDQTLALRVLSAWATRSSSEVSILRSQILMSDGAIAGGFISLGGLELKRARKADAIALATTISETERSGVLERLSDAANLFSPVDDDEYYLSKMGLDHRFRRKGYGKQLLSRYLEEGQARGHTRYRLDVYARNAAAVRLYLDSGFQITRRGRTNNGAIEYYAMTYQRASSL